MDESSFTSINKFCFIIRIKKKKERNQTSYPLTSLCPSKGKVTESEIKKNDQKVATSAAAAAATRPTYVFTIGSNSIKRS